MLSLAVQRIEKPKKLVIERCFRVCATVQNSASANGLECIEPGLDGVASGRHWIWRIFG
jgi:hypothetical protein